METEQKIKKGIAFAILAAALYAINAPFSKILLEFMPPTLMAGFLYVGAGIGMILGRYKLITMFGGTMSMKNVSPTVKKVFEMSGVTKIIPIIEEQGGTKIGKCV